MSAGEADLQVQQARSMQAPKRWPLVNTLNSRSNVFTKDARLVNAYAEKDRTTGEYQVEKRPGFSSQPVIPGTGQGQGIFGFQYYSIGAIPNRLNPGSPVIQPFSFKYILTVENGVLFYTTYQGTTVVVPKTSLGPIQVNYGGLGPSKVEFLSVAGTFYVLLGAGATYWKYVTNYLGDPNQGLGALAYIVTIGAAFGVPTGNLSLSVLTPDIPLGNGPQTVPGGFTYYAYPISTVPGFVILDGFLYVMDISGTIWETVNQNDPTMWNPAASITAATDSDFGVQLARQLIYIVAIKTWTTQFYYDAGNQTGSSLSPIPGAVYNVGCLSSDTFCDLDGVLFWVTQSKEGTYQVVKVDNLQMEPVSNPAVERALDLGPGQQWYSHAYQWAGHRWYILSNVTNNVTMVYDIGEKIWYLWTDFAGNLYPVADRCPSPTGQEWHQMISTGNVYVMDADYVYPNDSGQIVPVDIYTPNFDDGIDRGKMLSQMRFNADQTPGSTLQVRYSDNDYGSWTNFRTVDLNQVRPYMNDEGTFHRRAYHFRHYANTKLRIRSLDLQMDICTL